MAHYLVYLSHGPAWDSGRSRRTQDGWASHARFMDALVAGGSIVLGGPVGEDVDSGDAVMLVCAGSMADAAAMFDDDPWHDTILTTREVVPWTLWLGSPADLG